MSGSARAALRFAVIYVPGAFAVWQLAAVERLVTSGDGQLVLLMADSAASPIGRASNVTRAFTQAGSLWRLFSMISEPAAKKTTSASKGLPRVAEIKCGRLPGDPSGEHLSEEAVAAVRDRDIDFILYFGDSTLSGPILEAARHGVWAFRFGSDLQCQSGAPYFWEIYHGESICSAMLLRLAGGVVPDVVLRTGFLKTLDYSYSRNYNRMLVEAADWPTYVASEIRNGAFSEVARRPHEARPSTRRSPSNLAVLRLFAALTRNVFRRIAQRFTREEWNIGIVPLTEAQVVGGVTVTGIKWFTNPRGGWVADPMAVANDNRVDILCERMDLNTAKGYIAAVRFDGHGWSTAAPAIQPGFHASYPYLVKTDGQIYCVPETCEANEVRLYRAVDFPYKWEFVDVLLPNFPAVDSTVFIHDGRWWLFATSQAASGHKLFAWHASNFLGPWHPHGANPIKVDVRSSRPAGPPFSVGGVLYRPAQDCSRTYGGRIVLNRIIELTPLRFAEEDASHVEPDPREPYGRALHTLCRAGDYFVVDGKRWRLRLFAAKLHQRTSPVQTCPSTQ